MTDRELLEMVAKAAGNSAVWVSTGYEQCFKIPYETGCTEGWRIWDPLRNDGDAFRLVAQLGLDIEFGNEHVWCCIEDMKNYVMHHFAGDRAAAARRVAVESAAAIQQAKEAQ